MDSIRVPRIYSGDDGESHWDEVDVPLTQIRTSYQSDFLPVRGIGWRIYEPADEPGAYHTAPAEQYVIVLSGRAEYGVADGEVRQFGAGELFIAADTTGHGHWTRGIGPGPRVALHVPFADVESRYQGA